MLRSGRKARAAAGRRRDSPVLNCIKIMTTTMNHEHCIESCNRLLRGERSAVETYDIALKHYDGNPEVVSGLARIRDEHVRAVEVLEENVLSMGGVPDRTSGAWGTMATTVQSTASMAGESVALSSLQMGEKAGQGGYEDALKDDEVMPACKQLISSKLLPRLLEHIATLEHLQKKA